MSDNIQAIVLIIAVILMSYVTYIIGSKFLLIQGNHLEKERELKRDSLMYRLKQECKWMSLEAEADYGECLEDFNVK